MRLIGSISMIPTSDYSLSLVATVPKPERIDHSDETKNVWKFEGFPLGDESVRRRREELQKSEIMLEQPVDERSGFAARTRNVFPICLFLTLRIAIVRPFSTCFELCGSARKSRWTSRTSKLRSHSSARRHRCCG